MPPTCRLSASWTPPTGRLIPAHVRIRRANTLCDNPALLLVWNRLHESAFCHSWCRHHRFVDGTCIAAARAQRFAGGSQCAGARSILGGWWHRLATVSVALWRSGVGVGGRGRAGLCGAGGGLARRNRHRCRIQPLRVADVGRYGNYHRRTCSNSNHHNAICRHPGSNRTGCSGGLVPTSSSPVDSL